MCRKKGRPHVYIPWKADRYMLTVIILYKYIGGRVVDKIGAGGESDEYKDTTAKLTATTAQSVSKVTLFFSNHG